MQAVSKSRDRRIDLIKAVSILCVLISHCGWYSDPVGSFHWGSAVFWGCLARPSVPLFMMCTGVLMLGPERDLSPKQIFCHFLPRLLLSMWVWAMVYKLPYCGLSPAALWQAFKEVLCLQQEFHFYYIHMCLILYLSLPVLQVLANLEDRRVLYWSLGLWFVFGILYPTVQPWWPFYLLGGMAPQFLIHMTWACLGYALLGRLLSQRPLPLWASALLFLCGYAMSYGGTWALSLRDGMLNESFFEGMSVPVCFMAAGAFGLLSRLAEHAGERDTKLWRLVDFTARGSFCAYLAHVLFIHLFQRIGLTQALLPRLVSVPLMALLVFSCCMGVYWVLRRIPFVSRWLV